MRKDGGFTLIELAIVLAIIAILAAAAAPRFADLTGRAGDRAAEATAAATRSAYGIYLANNSQRPNCAQLFAQMDGVSVSGNTGTITSPNGSTTTLVCAQTGTPPVVTTVDICNNRAATYNNCGAAANRIRLNFQ